MEIVTVVNRLNKAVEGTWDGKRYEIAPLGEVAVPTLVASAIKRQNPIMGSGNMWDGEAGMTGRMQYKVGIKESGDPCTPLGTVKEGVERWDRDKLVGARPSQVVDGDNGMYRPPSANLSIEPTVMTRE